MRALPSLFLVAAIAVLVAGSAQSAASRTVVVRWSPFDAAGDLKSTLNVEETVNGGCTDIGYTYFGGIGYRCGSGNGLYKGCFRDGPDPTDYVICVGVPWRRTVTRLRSPHLLLYPGVTFTRAAQVPWAIVLADGNRCGPLHLGAHDVVRTRGRTYVVDYACERDDIALLREGIRRGRTWYVNAARWSRRRGYTFLGHRPIRRVYFGTLPPAMARQNQLANGAYNAAIRVIRRRAPKASLALAWVRIALPRGDWAHVIFASGGASGRGSFAVLRRVGGRWTDASAFKPYCSKLPPAVRRQLFLGRRTRIHPTAVSLAPRGETRC